MATIGRLPNHHLLKPGCTPSDLCAEYRREYPRATWGARLPAGGTLLACCKVRVGDPDFCIYLPPGVAATTGG